MTFRRGRALGTFGALAHPAPPPAALSDVALYSPADAMTTMRKMAHYVDVALSTPYVIDRANAIIARAAPRDWPDQVNAIRQYVERVFRFVDNPIGRQRIQPVALMLERIDATGSVMGACNDAADLIAALGMANGLPARFVAYAFCEDGTPADDTPFSHVIADLFDGARWITLDVTRPLEMFRLPCVARMLTLELE